MSEPDSEERSCCASTGNLSRSPSVGLGRCARATPRSRQRYASTKAAGKDAASGGEDGRSLQREPALRLQPGMDPAEQRGLIGEQEACPVAVERDGTEGPSQ